MVSPYKKKKLERRGRVTLEANPPKNSLDSRRIRSSKPLSNKKFYLDIKNHATLKKIENKLTSLGAGVELFLVKDVYCVVTDRDEYISSRNQQAGRNTPRGLVTPSPFCSVSPATTDSPGDGVISKRTRSRAEAMLEKVKQQPQKTTHDILDNAIGWGIPIYSYTKFLVWLEKIARKEVKDPKGIRELRGHYLKLETGCGRPDFRQFRVWPRISYNGDEPTAFPKPLSKHDPQRMTRKAGKVAKDSSAAPGGNGYCEMCRTHFDQLDAHIASSQHVRYASDPSHYTQLDSLISHHDLGNMGSLRKSLRIAKSPPVDITIVKATPTAPPEGTTAPVINGHVTRSKSDKILSNGLSPLQEKRKNSIRGSGGGNSVAVEKKEETAVKVEPPEDHNLRPRHQPSRVVPPAPQTPTAARRNRLSSRKRLSVEEKLIEDNKSYYKVEVLNSKLRSTEFFINQKQLEARVNEGVVNGNCTPEKIPDPAMNQQTPPESKEQEKEPVVVRFKKVRRSQLALLSDEAENFMFGESTKKDSRKDEDASSSDESSDSEGSSIAEEVIPKKKVRKLVINGEGPTTPHKSSAKGTEPPSILSPPPRLKSPRRVPSAVDLSEEGKDESSEDESDINLDSITFGFENPPKNDPWVETLKRREEGKNMFYYPHYHTYPTVPLPCDYPLSERFKLLAGKKGPGFCKRRDRFFRLLDEGKPRKSPRCHASTLAIMSSLMRRRPIRECTSNPDFTYEEESRSSLPETIESSSSASEIRTALSINGDSNQLPIDPNGDVYAIALARLACGETSSLQVGSGPCLPVSQMLFDDLPEVGIDLKPGLSVPLETIINQQHNSAQFPRSLDMDFRFLDRDRDSGSDCSDLIGFSDDGRGISSKRRKRKRNLTGWPIEKPRKKVIKKEEEPPSAPVTPVMIKCEPCEIKLEPMCPEVLQQLTCSVKQEMSTFNGGESPLVPVKRGRGRPRKYPPLLTAVTPLSPSTKSSPVKGKIPKFNFTARRSCIK